MWGLSCAELALAATARRQLRQTCARKQLLPTCDFKHPRRQELGKLCTRCIRNARSPRLSEPPRQNEPFSSCGRTAMMPKPGLLHMSARAIRCQAHIILGELPPGAMHVCHIVSFTPPTRATIGICTREHRCPFGKIDGFP